jgi:endoglucanase
MVAACCALMAPVAGAASDPPSGTGPRFAPIPRVEFGDVIVGTVSRGRGLTVQNSGDQDLTIAHITVLTSEFELYGGSCQEGTRLAPGEACGLLIRFRPQQVGAVSGSMYIDAGSTGIGVAMGGRGARAGYSCSNDRSLPAQRDRANPLELAAHDRHSPNPLSGANFFVDSREGLAVPYIKRFNEQGRFHDAALLGKIAAQPETKRFSRFTREGAYRAVRQLMCRIPLQQPGAIPLLSLYRLEHEHCGNHSGDSPGEQRAYRRWVDAFARAVNLFPAVIFYEFDSLITTPCLNSRGLRIRLAELRYGIRTLARLPHAVVYLDGGAADALPYRRTAQLLNRVGLRPIQGFFLNSTHFDSTRNEVAYGRKVSRLVHGKPFVVSTAVNGNGPLRPRNRRRGNEVLCNPPGRALGTRPTTRTGNPLVDGYLWIGNPGRSGGRCHPGDARNGYFDVRYALSLARNAHF